MHPGKASPPHSPFRPQFKKSPKEQTLANPDWDKITSRWQNSQIHKIKSQNSMYKVLTMNLNNFQGEQFWKIIWKNV